MTIINEKQRNILIGGAILTIGVYLVGRQVKFGFEYHQTLNKTVLKLKDYLRAQPNVFKWTLLSVAKGVVHPKGGWAQFYDTMRQRGFAKLANELTSLPSRDLKNVCWRAMVFPSGIISLEQKITPSLVNKAYHAAAGLSVLVTGGMCYSSRSAPSDFNSPDVFPSDDNSSDFNLSGNNPLNDDPLNDDPLNDDPLNDDPLSDFASGDELLT